MGVTKKFTGFVGQRDALYPLQRAFLFLNINQLDALNFIISLFQASACFEHMCSWSEGQICIIQ